MSQDNRHELSPLVSRRRAIVLPGSLLVLAVTAAGFYFQHSTSVPDAKSDSRGDKRGHDEDAPVAVAVETVGQSDFPVYLNGLGTVTALRTVIVRPRVDGELIRVVFSEGQIVKEGELLAEIDPRPFQIQPATGRRSVAAR